MELLSHLLNHDPACPRLTVYDESTGARPEFSAQTLDNWVAKIANMLYEELEMEPGDSVLLDLPVSWQAVAIYLGCTAAGVDASFDVPTGELPPDIPVVFCAPDRVAAYPAADVVVVTNDAFGRGVVEIGGQVPPGVVDFGPTVRFYGDVFSQPTPDLPELVGHSHLPDRPRVLSTGWHDDASFIRNVLSPLAAGGSVVVVTGGMVTGERLARISEIERCTVSI